MKQIFGGFPFSVKVQSLSLTCFTPEIAGPTTNRELLSRDGTPLIRDSRPKQVQQSVGGRDL